MINTMSDAKIIKTRNKDGHKHVGANVPLRNVHDRLSQVAENYLLSLYVLKEEGQRATAGHLADHLKGLPVGEGLGTSLPSVLGMLRRMAKEGLIQLTADKEVKLTAVGLIEAEDMVRRHRLAERMVVDVFGLELYKAHEEAHRLEHAISPEMESLIKDKLGNPTTCPFGGPIPGSGYVSPIGGVISLGNAKSGNRYDVQRVPEEDQSLLEFLVNQNILPDQTIEILEASPSRGIISVRTNVGEASLGYVVADKIWLRSSDN